MKEEERVKRGKDMQEKEKKEKEKMKKERLPAPAACPGAGGGLPHSMTWAVEISQKCLKW